MHFFLPNPQWLHQNPSSVFKTQGMHKLSDFFSPQVSSARARQEQTFISSSPPAAPQLPSPRFIAVFLPDFPSELANRALPLSFPACPRSSLPPTALDVLDKNFNCRFLLDFLFELANRALPFSFPLPPPLPPTRRPRRLDKLFISFFFSTSFLNLLTALCHSPSRYRCPARPLSALDV